MKSKPYWIKTKGEKFIQFHWQDGYGAFSVSPGAVDIVSKYIENQEQHHNRNKFRDEYVKLLKENNIDFDERYLWD